MYLRNILSLLHTSFFLQNSVTEAAMCIRKSFFQFLQYLTIMFEVSAYGKVEDRLFRQNHNFLTFLTINIIAGEGVTER